MREPSIKTCPVLSFFVFGLLVKKLYRVSYTISSDTSAVNSLGSSSATPPMRHASP